MCFRPFSEKWVGGVGCDGGLEQQKQNTGLGEKGMVEGERERPGDRDKRTQRETARPRSANSIRRRACERSCELERRAWVSQGERRGGEPGEVSWKTGVYLPTFQLLKEKDQSGRQSAGPLRFLCQRGVCACVRACVRVCVCVCVCVGVGTEWMEVKSRKT